MEYTDNTKMPFGKHQGKALEDVPASYLLYLYELPNPINNQMLLNYIDENYQALELERTKKKQ
ncbi:MAG: hypothetical protein ACJASM_002040 [Salibacteraceae bacterium]|jgi:uncharacterized protein (DUF3820 family)